MILLALLGQELMAPEGLTGAAIAWFERALELAESMPPSPWITAMWINLARALDRDGNAEAAEALLLKVPWPDRGPSVEDRSYTSDLLSHLLVTGRQLEKMGATESARVQAETLLLKAEGYDSDYYLKQARRLMEKISGG